MAYKKLKNSSFLDLAAYRVTNSSSVVEAYELAPSEHSAVKGKLPGVMRVAIVLGRANSPDKLLDASWGERQKALKELNDAGNLWTTYGAKESEFDSALSIVRDKLGLRVLGSESNLITSAAARTIWVEINNSDEFERLFGTKPRVMSAATTNNQTITYWDGDLSIDDRLSPVGIYFNFGELFYAPPATDFSPTSSAAPPEGPLSIGNNSAVKDARKFSPRQLSDYYRFPLANKPEIQVAPIGLIQPNIGSAMAPSAARTLNQLTREYLESLGLVDVSVEITNTGDQFYNEGDAAERDLDVSVVSSINPGGHIRLYSGASTGNYLADKYEESQYPYRSSSSFSALQAAIWDQNQDLRPNVLSTSFSDDNLPSPGSVFMIAQRELLKDAAIGGITFFSSAGDKGSNIGLAFGKINSLANGLSNAQAAHANAFGVSVGGSSLSTLRAAKSDPTLNDITSKFASSLVAAVANSDRSALWNLIKGGLVRSWNQLQDSSYFIETTWNEAEILPGNLIEAFPGKATGGGVDPTQTLPSYQERFGLQDLRTSDPQGLAGRGIPDVAAAAGGNSYYKMFDSKSSDSLNIAADAGTSASAPLWAALAVQINAILKDQDPALPPLGYMNDLLYTAAAVAPASFNDVLLGNINRSFSMGGDYSPVAMGDSIDTKITLKDFGYQAGEGYDLVTGLGTPNGILLARAISSLVHHEMSSLEKPELLTPGMSQTWRSPVNQSLLFQPVARNSGEWKVQIDETAVFTPTEMSGPYSWTRRFAQQTLQRDFSSKLAVLFDAQSLGHVSPLDVTVGDHVDVSLNGELGIGYRTSLTSSHGFVDFGFGSLTSEMQVARPVAIGITTGSKANQEAIVRLRQVGSNDVSVRFYKVDDLTGMINGVSPGDSAYEKEVASRLYRTTSGATSIAGGGYGVYSEDRLKGINNGDLIAMSLKNSEGDTFYSFSRANEYMDGKPIAHIRNFGLNTWGWEDVYGGGDLDFNDLVVGLDFVSSAGTGILA